MWSLTYHRLSGEAEHDLAFCGWIWQILQVMSYSMEIYI